MNGLIYIASFIEEEKIEEDKRREKGLNGSSENLHRNEWPYCIIYCMI